MSQYIESPEVLFCPSEEEQPGFWDVSKSWSTGDNFNQLYTYGLRERGAVGVFGKTISLEDIKNPANDYLVVDEWCRSQFKPWCLAASPYFVELRHCNTCNTLYSDGSSRSTEDEYFLNIESENWLQYRISYPEDKFLPPPPLGPF